MGESEPAVHLWVFRKSYTGRPWMGAFLGAPFSNLVPEHQVEGAPDPSEFICRHVSVSESVLGSRVAGPVQLEVGFIS